MKARARFALQFVSTLSGLLALSGCSLPQAQSDPTRFYVLSTAATAPTPMANEPRLSVLLLREIELASYLRSRPLIVRRGENEIEFREFALWGESLDNGIARVLREELLARGAVTTVVSSSSRREPANPEMTLSVRVLACEGAANGDVVFRAIWELGASASKPVTVARGDFRAVDLRWDGKTEASLAAQLSQAVAALGGEIATALKKG